MSTSFTNLQAIPIDGALPTQNTSTVGKALISNGTNAGWNTVLSMIGNGAGQSTGDAVATAILPVQTGQAGKILSTNGAGVLSWVTDAGAIAGVSGIKYGVDPTIWTGAVTITNVPSATVAGNVSGTVGLGNGGTGATSAGDALIALGAAAAVHTHAVYAPINAPAFTGIPTATVAIPPNDNTTRLATTAFVTNSLGDSRTRQYLTASRVVNTTYTNTTGHNIEVVVTFQIIAATAFGEFFVDGNMIATSGKASANTDRYAITATILPGQTYRLSGTIVIISWSELR